MSLLLSLGAILMMAGCAGSLPRDVVVDPPPIRKDAPPRRMPRVNYLMGAWRPIEPATNVREGEFYVEADPERRRLRLVNATREMRGFDTCSDCLLLVQEALNLEGEWRPIEVVISSYCGNSYHTLWLPPGQFLEVETLRYEGSLRTRLRFRLFIEMFRMEGSLVSDEFVGNVDPEQFYATLRDDRVVSAYYRD